MHKSTPKNLFERIRVPHRTILVSILFFTLGTYFLFQAISEWIQHGKIYGTGQAGAEPYEKLILGSILFIPGSYHTFLAIMAYLRAEGFSYNDVATFESEDWW